MKRLIASLGLTAAIAMPVNGQNYQMSASESALADAYGALGASVGFLLCDAQRIGITDPERVFDNMASRLTQGDAEMLGAVLEMPDNNYYKKRYIYNVMYNLDAYGCYDQFFKMIEGKY